MGFRKPQSPRPDSDEREELLSYIHWQREQVVATTEGLSEDQLRWSPDGRLLPIIGIINHLTHMEWRWIEGRYLGQPFPPRKAEFTLRQEVTSDRVVDAYWRQGQRTEDIVRAAPSVTVPCLGD